MSARRTLKRRAKPERKPRPAPVAKPAPPRIWTPADDAVRSRVDTRVDRLIRGKHVERLLSLADQFDDEAFDAASSGHPRRADYLEFWVGRIRERATTVANEPLTKLGIRRYRGIYVLPE